MKRVLLIILTATVLLSVTVTACSSGSIAGEYSRDAFTMVLTENGNFYVSSEVVFYQGQWAKQGDNLYLYFVHNGNDITVLGEVSGGKIIINPPSSYSGFFGTWEKVK